MPRKGSVSKNLARAGNQATAVKKSLPEKEFSVSDTSSDDTPADKLQRKRNFPPSQDHDEASVPNDADFGLEFRNLINGFSDGINKALQSKKKRVQLYAKESIQTASKKVLEISKTQTSERRILWEEFQKQISEILDQETVELEKSRESEDQMMKVVQQQQEMLHTLQAQHTQNIQLMKELSDTFFKGMSELECYHVDQYAKVHDDLRKEMQNLQKKFLQDTQQEEMTNMRNQLRNMLR